MIKKATTFIFAFFVTAFIHAQVEKIDTTNGVTREIYYLDKNGFKQGDYKFEYKDLVQVSGKYTDNLKNGLWIYQPDKYFKLIGYYKSDTIDSIWNCYIKNIKYSSHNYVTGERRCYYPNGKLMIRGDSIDGKYHFIEYSKRGKVIKLIDSDSVFTIRKEFNKKGDLIEHIIFKNGFPYELIKTTESDKKLVYAGNIKEGSGFMQTKIKSLKTEKFYLYETVNLIDSKPDGKYNKLTEEGKVLVSGQYQNGYMINDWIRYNSKTFIVDTIISYSLSDSIEKDEDNFLGFMNGSVSVIVDDMPAFNGESYQNFARFIYRNLKYPKVALDHKIEGRVYVKFEIDKTGKIENAVVIKGVHEILDNEALKVVNSAPYWRPGLRNGVQVRVSFTLPIIFVIR